jgi:hypothetical protein
VGGVQQFPVDVELVLAPRVVADPYGGAAPPTGEVGEHSFTQVVFAADAVHDL